jgi:type I restriction enzyme S subunit
MDVKQGYKQTELGVIPQDWEVSLLDSVAKRGSGHTPDKAHPEYWNGQIKWISLQDSDRLDHVYIYDTAAKITPHGIANSSAKMHPEGTVVLSRDAGVGKSAIMKDGMAVSQHFIAWQCGPLLNNHFLYYWLQANKSEFQRIAMGNTIKTIGLPYFRQLVIPRPTKAEQEAIAAALSDADALIESLERLIVKKRHVKEGAAQKLFTGKIRLPGFSETWDVKILEESCDVITKGTTPTSLGRDFTSSGINFLKAESIGESGQPVFGKMAFIDQRTHKLLKRSQLMQGDLLISIAGVLGRVGVVEKHVLPANTNQALAIIRLGKESDFERNYLFYYLRSRMVQRHISDISVRAAQANISLRNVRELRISVPRSSAEQTAVASALRDIDAEIATLEAKLFKARQLKQGMMQELLTGKVRLV